MAKKNKKRKKKIKKNRSLKNNYSQKIDNSVRELPNDNPSRQDIVNKDKENLKINNSKLINHYYTVNWSSLDYNFFNNKNISQKIYNLSNFNFLTIVVIFSLFILQTLYLSKVGFTIVFLSSIILLTILFTFLDKKLNNKAFKFPELFTLLILFFVSIYLNIDLDFNVSFDNFSYKELLFFINLSIFFYLSSRLFKSFFKPVDVYINNMDYFKSFLISFSYSLSWLTVLSSIFFIFFSFLTIIAMFI